jgi:hypothetical protein
MGQHPPTQEEVSEWRNAINPATSKLGSKRTGALQGKQARAPEVSQRTVQNVDMSQHPPTREERNELNPVPPKLSPKPAAPVQYAASPNAPGLSKDKRDELREKAEKDEIKITMSEGKKKDKAPKPDMGVEGRRLYSIDVNTEGRNVGSADRYELPFYMVDQLSSDSATFKRAPPCPITGEKTFEINTDPLNALYAEVEVKGRPFRATVEDYQTEKPSAIIYPDGAEKTAYMIYANGAVTRLQITKDPATGDELLASSVFDPSDGQPVLEGALYAKGNVFVALTKTHLMAFSNGESIMLPADYLLKGAKEIEFIDFVEGGSSGKVSMDIGILTTEWRAYTLTIDPADLKNITMVPLE